MQVVMPSFTDAFRGWAARQTANNRSGAHPRRRSDGAPSLSRGGMNGGGDNSGTR